MRYALGMNREQIARRIAEVALLRGDFTLRNGRKSHYYLDKYLFSTQPDILRELGVMFAAKLPPPPQVTKPAGAELGGIPLVASASMASGLPCVFIRNQKKEYGTAKQPEGELEPGRPRGDHRRCSHHRRAGARSGQGDRSDRREGRENHRHDRPRRRRATSHRSGRPCVRVAVHKDGFGSVSLLGDWVK